MKLGACLAVLAVVTTPRIAVAGEIELLHNVNAQVAVSSQVDNYRIHSEHLLDGDTGTAWNSKTGDLVGSWIAFRLPAEVEVASVKLIVGHTGSGPEGDYFTLNHRIKRVRVTRDGAALGEFTLDPDQRGLQTIAIKQPGGEYRIEVLETVPGTNPRWREMCVAELEVWGTLPPQMKARPRKFDAVSVGVGKLKPRHLDYRETYGPYPDVDTLCKQHGCKTGDPKLGATWHVTAASSIREAQVVRSPALGDKPSAHDTPALVIRTKDGWWHAGQVSWIFADRWPATIDTLSIANDTVTLTVTRTGSHSDHATVTLLCGVGTNKPRCLVPLVVSAVSMKAIESEHIKLTLAADWLSIDAEDGFYRAELSGDYHLTW
jgi:hypothetical protein